MDRLRPHRRARGLRTDLHRPARHPLRPGRAPARLGSGGDGRGIAGVGLLLGVDLSAEALALAGGLLVLLAGLGYAAGGLYLKRRLADVPPVGGAAVAMAASALATLPLAAVQRPRRRPRSARSPPLGSSASRARDLRSSSSTRIVGGSWVAAEGRLPGRRRRAAPIAEPVAGSLPRS